MHHQSETELAERELAMIEVSDGRAGVLGAS